MAAVRLIAPGAKHFRFFTNVYSAADVHMHHLLYLCPRAADLGVPLLAVQTHLDALTQEETGPHDDVEHGALALVVHGEVEHH